MNEVILRNQSDNFSDSIHITQSLPTPHPAKRKCPCRVMLTDGPSSPHVSVEPKPVTGMTKTNDHQLTKVEILLKVINQLCENWSCSSHRDELAKTEFLNPSDGKAGVV